MSTVFIIITQNLLTTAPNGGISTDELVLGVPVALSRKDDFTTITSWAWSFVDKPQGSAATLSTPTTAVSGFTPDVAGTYLIRLTVNGVDWAQVGAAVKTAGLHYRIPAIEEEFEFDNGNVNQKGWGPAINVALQDIDDGYVVFTESVPPLIGTQYAVLLEDPIGTHAWEKLTADKILDKYAITNFASTGSTVVEIGSTVIQPAFTASYNRAAITVSINDGLTVNSIALPATSFAYNGSLLPSKNYTKTAVNAQQSFILTASDGIGTPTATELIKWQPNVFFGSQVAFGDFASFFPNGDFEDLTSAPWVLNPYAPDAYVGVTNKGASYILNGDFEGGNLTGWTIATGLDVSGTGIGTATGVAIATTIDKHSGTYSMLLGSSTLASFAGDVSASQNIDVPLLGTTSLSFWFKTNAPDGLNYDWFQAHVRNSAGTTVLIDLFAGIGLIGSHRATPTGGTNPPPLGEIGPVFYETISTWTNVVVDLTPYAGQTVKLFFLAEDDNATPAPTRLFIDDIQVTNTYAHSGTKFGQVYATNITGGSLYQLLSIPMGTTFVDGYYRAYGNGSPGSDSQFIRIMDNTLTTTLITVVSDDVNTAPGNWQYFSSDVSAYAGMTVGIAVVVDGAPSGALRVLEVDDFNINTSGADVGGYLSALSSQLQPSKVSSSITVTINNNEYFIWVGPASYNAVADNFIDAETGLPIGMIKTNALVDVTNLYGVVVAYDIWQSEYGSLGQLTFVVRNNNE